MKMMHCVLLPDAQTMLLQLPRYPVFTRRLDCLDPKYDHPPRNEVKATFCIYPSDVVWLVSAPDLPQRAFSVKVRPTY